MMEDSEKSLEKKIITWLDKGGYPLEMRTANSFLKSNFEVAQSVYFQDAETEKFRETDVIARCQLKLKNDFWVILNFVIECKKIENKPWLVFKNNRLNNLVENKLPVYQTKNFKSVSLKIEENKFRSDLLYSNQRTFGYSLQEAFNSGNDKAYNTYQSLTKACEYFSTSYNRHHNVCSLFFPVIIVEGKLFETSMKTKDKIEIKNVNQSELFLTRSGHEFGNSVILIFDDSNLDQVAKRLKQICGLFFDNYNNELNKFLE